MNVADQIGIASQSITPNVVKNDITVTDLKNTNVHVQNLNGIMLKAEEVVVTNASQEAHRVVQWLLTAGFPASTIPAFYNNPRVVSVGLGAGLIIGGVMRFISTAQMDPSLQNFQDWGQHLASMNAPSVVGNIGTKTALAVGNTVGNIFVQNNDTYSLLQGVFAGTHLGFEITGVVMTSINQILAAWHAQNSQMSPQNNQQEGKSEETPLVVNSTTGHPIPIASPNHIVVTV